MIIPHPQPHAPDPSPAEFSTNKSLKIKKMKKTLMPYTDTWKT
jgi:hypothetical protein